MGNVFLKITEIENAIKQTEAAMYGLDYDEAVERGFNLCCHSNNKKDISDVLNNIPDGLRQAHENNKGFIAFARPQM